MEIFEKDYIVGVWFADKPKFGNWQMIVVKREGKWVSEYRFRYYADEKVFGSQDRKSFYSLQIPDTVTEQEVIANCTEMMDLMISKLGYERSDYMEVKGDIGRFQWMMSTRPWAHVKTVDTTKLTKEETEALKNGEYPPSFEQDPKPKSRRRFR